MDENKLVFAILGQGFAYCGNRNKHMQKKHSATDEELDQKVKLHQCMPTLFFRAVVDLTCPL